MVWQNPIAYFGGWFKWLFTSVSGLIALVAISAYIYFRIKYGGGGSGDTGSTGGSSYRY